MIREKTTPALQRLFKIGCNFLSTKVERLKVDIQDFCRQFMAQTFRPDVLLDWQKMCYAAQHVDVKSTHITEFPGAFRRMHKVNIFGSLPDSFQDIIICRVTTCT